jgi:hypothetical protein
VTSLTSGLRPAVLAIALQDGLNFITRIWRYLNEPYQIGNLSIRIIA